MTLYEIDENILKCFDPDTGELLDEAALAALELQRTEKLENIALWIKNLSAEEIALRKEARTLQTRYIAKARAIDRLRDILSQAMSSEVLETARVKISTRSMKSVEIDDEGALYAAAPEFFHTEETRTLDKSGLKEALKSRDIDGARLVDKSFLIIK